MMRESAVEGNEMGRVTRKGPPAAALASGALGVVAAVWVYWLVVPGFVLGVAAVVLGVRARRNGDTEGGSVAVTLGIVAVLLVPSVLAVVAMAEDYARNCALHPTQSDC
jgi:hypothetical protein